MKKAMQMLLGLVMVVSLLAGCSAPAATEKASEAPSAKPAEAKPTEAEAKKAEEPKEKLKLAVLVPGSINDGAFSALGYNSLMALADELRAQGYEVETSYTEAKSPQDAEEGLDNYGAEGYNLVYAHDYAMGDAVTRTAPLYPDTLYLVSSGQWSGKNYSSFISQTTEIGYQQGAMAAVLSKSKKVGVLGGEKMPSISRFIIASTQGVKDTDPSVEVVETYLGAQNDLGKAREATLALINGGCDVIIASVSAATQGMMQGAQEAKDSGKDIYIFTNTSNQSKDYPEIFISTATVDTLAEIRMAWDYWVNNNKTLPNEPFKAGTKEKCTIQIWNPAMETSLPKEVYEAREKAEAGIWDGSIVINVPDF